MGSFSVLGATIKDLGQHSSACLFSCCRLPVVYLCEASSQHKTYLVFLIDAVMVQKILQHSSMSHSVSMSQKQICVSVLYAYFTEFQLFLSMFNFFFFFLQKHVELSLKTEEQEF